MRLICTFLAIAVLLSVFPAFARPQQGIPTLVVINAETTKAMWTVVDELAEEGYKTRVIFPPNFLFVDPKNEDPAALLGRDYVEGVHTDRIADTALYGRYANGEKAVNAFNYVYFDDAAPKGEPPPNVHKDAVFLIPEDLRESYSEGDRAESPPYGGTASDTSEYMMGDVSAQIIFPESTGSQENWTQGRKDTCINEVTLALNWWTETYPEDDLTFVLHDVTASTSYEPITMSQSQEGQWIGDCLDDLGYSGSGYFNQCRDFANDNRDNDGTDWTFLMFIVDSYNDADGMFQGGYFAYAYLGGPFHVMTYDNDYWGIGNMDIVCAHETGHTFYALDEYPGSPWTPYSGYLNVYNGNWEGSIPCIMNSSSYQFQAWNSHDNCVYTDETLGWRDDDNDGLQDILDVEPETWLDEYLPDPTDEPIVTYTGTTQVQTYPNENPFGNGNDIHIGYINVVQWKQNPPSDPHYATASDGAFDEPEEDYTFNSKPLQEGENEFRAFCYVKWYTGYNVRDLTAAADFLTYDPDETGIEDLNLALTYDYPRTVYVTWEDPAGEFAGFNLYRSVENRESGAAAIGYGDKLNDELITGETPYRYADGGAELDITYRYTLEALTVSGNTESVSRTITPGESKPTAFALYQNAPNPVVHGTALVTFALPEACDVELTLYDVSGRKVVDVLNDYFNAGYHQISLEADLPSGVYVYHIKAGDYSAAKKMVIEN
jgi:hypothetical protein